MSIYKYPINNNEISKKNNFKYIKPINITKPVSMKEYYNCIKDLFRNIFQIIAIFIHNKRMNSLYVAIICEGGFGDIVRSKCIIEEIIKMYPDIIIDVYNKKAKKLYYDIKQIRFYLNIDSIFFTKNKYDVIYNAYGQVIPIKINKNSNTDKIVNNLIKYKKDFLFAFEDNITQCNKNGINFIALSKILCGMDNVFDTTFSVMPKKCSLLKFGITEDMKFITFQCGAGDTGTLNNAKCWDINNWNKMLYFVKNKIDKKIKIIQLGTGDCYVKQADICLLKKTYLDELIYILSKSILHIDIDGACSHFAKAVGTKSLIMFGATDGIPTSYNENINIISSVCTPCGKNKCFKGQNICMQAIDPEFVADKVIEYIKECKF